MSDTAERHTFNLEAFRAKANTVLAAMDPNVMADRFEFFGRHWWVVRGKGVSACICQQCTKRGRVA